MEKSCGTMTYMSLTRVSKSNCLRPPFQSDAKCDAINIPMIFLLVQIKLIVT